MRAWYVNRRNEPVLDVRMMVSFACALILVLAWLLPREENFRQMLAEEEADHVSVAYARLLHALYSNDEEYRHLLAVQYLKIGELERAWEITGAENGAVSLLRIMILERLMFSRTDPEARSRWSGLLRRELDLAAETVSLDEEAAAVFVHAAYAVERPDLVARYYQRRYRETGAQTDLMLAATAWRAADRADAAAALYSSLDPEQTAGLSDAMVEEALQAFLAAGRFESGFRFIDAVRSRRSAADVLAVRFVTFAQMADAPERMAFYLEQLNGSDLSDTDLLRVAGAAIAAGELGRAAHFFEVLLERHPEELDAREQLARVYRWSDRPQAALAQWLELVERTGLEAHVISAWKLAEGLYRYDISAELLTSLADSRRLSDTELRSLRDAYELQGLPDRAIVVFERYVDRYPGHRQAWQSLIDLQTANGDLADASDSWARYARHHVLDAEEYLRRADLLWKRFHTDEAVAVLLAAETSDSAGYWRRLANYGWFLDDMSLVARAYGALAGIAPLSEDQFERLFAAVARTAPEKVAAWADYGWERYRQPEYLLEALRRAMADGDHERVRALLAMSEPEQALFRDSAEYWELVAYYHQQQGDLSRAEAVLVSALEHHPEHPALIAPYLWLLVQAGGPDELIAALDRFEPIAEAAGELWPVYGAAYARLNEHGMALAWFGRAVDARPDDLALLLSYAASLEAAGLNDPAFRIRRHVIGEMIAGRDTQSLTLVDLSQAGRGVLNADQKQQLARWLMAGSGAESDDAQWPKFYLAEALARTHYSAAGFWMARDRDPDPWARLAVAADRGDRRTLEQLLGHDDPLIGINAALSLDRPELAYTAPGMALLSERERLGVATSYYARFPTGWQLAPEHSRLSGLEIDSVLLKGAHRFGAFAVSAELAAYRLRDAQHLLPGESREWLAELRAARRNGLGELAMAASVLDSSGEKIPGFVVSQSVDINRYHQLRVGGAYQQLTEITALARAVSQRSGLDLDWQSGLGRRNRLSLSASLDYYQDRFGDRLGTGGQFEARLDHAWRIAGPEVLVGATLYMTRNDQKSPGDDLLEELLVSRDELLLPDSTGRVALNASVSRGSPGVLNWEFPSPRYRLGAAVGYQWPESSPTFDLEASLGIRVLGNDELSFRAVYTSALLSAIGGDGYRATLTYSKRLGR